MSVKVQIQLQHQMNSTAAKQKISLKRSSKHISTAPDEPINAEERNFNHHRFLFNNLFKDYNKLIIDLKLDHDNMSTESVEIILFEMGYLGQHKSTQSQEILESVIHVLNSPNNGVTVTNLFKFILLIENVEYQEKYFKEPANILVIELDKRDKPIGVYNNDGDWDLEDHQKLGIRKLYQQLYFNRLAHDRPQSFQDPKTQQFSFSPEILTKSKVLAEKQRTRMRNFSRKNLLASDSHEELLIMSKKMNQQKLKQVTEKLEQEEKKRCPFRPKINLRKKSVDEPKDRCLHLYERSKSPYQSVFQPSGQEKENKILKQCTFHPSNNSRKPSLSHIPLAKNSKSSIERIKQGHHSRQMSKTFKERGYPKNMPNWTKFFHSQKKKMLYNPNKTGTFDYTSSKNPILTIKIQLGGEQQSLDIYSGDSLQNLACKILVMNNISSSYLEAVERSLYESIKNTNSRIRIEKGFLYEPS